MGQKKMTMSTKVRKYMREHPKAAPSDIAQALGVKLTLVYAVRYHDSKKRKRMQTLAQQIQSIQSTQSTQPTQPTPAADLVNTPPHYTTGGIETIDFLEAKLTKEEFVGYLKGNVLKYGSRLGKKGDVMLDAGKMAWYAAKLRDTLRVAA